MYGKGEWRGWAVEVVDTGGIVPDDKALIPQQILRQAHVDIKKAALLVLVVDSQAGLTPLDEELARLLRTTGKPFVLPSTKSTPCRRNPTRMFSIASAFQSSPSLPSTAPASMISSTPPSQNFILPLPL